MQYTNFESLKNQSRAPQSLFQETMTTRSQTRVKSQKDLRRWNTQAFSKESGVYWSEFQFVNDLEFFCGSVIVSVSDIEAFAGSYFCELPPQTC